MNRDSNGYSQYMLQRRRNFDKQAELDEMKKEIDELKSLLNELASKITS